MLQGKLLLYFYVGSGFQAFSNHYVGYLAWLNISSDLREITASGCELNIDSAYKKLFRNLG